ncbi:MAG: HAD family acid phosphatase, partial [Bacteroidota bacterium]
MKTYSWILLFLLIGSCKTTEPSKQTATPEPTDIAIPVREYSIQSVLWQQLSAEYKALCHQAFNLARLQLDHQLLLKQEGELPLAIITDIDETVLDNSPFNAKMIETDEEYSKENWIKWGQLEEATAVPGAL